MMFRLVPTRVRQRHRAAVIGCNGVQAEDFRVRVRVCLCVCVCVVCCFCRSVCFGA